MVQLSSKDIRNLRVSAWRRRVKKRCVEYLGGKCRVCGYDKCLDALAFHHRDPEAKEFRISAYGFGWDHVKAELDKCDLLCVRCHIEVHAKWREASTLRHERLIGPPKRHMLPVEVCCAWCSKPKKVPHSVAERSARHFCDKTCKGLFSRKPQATKKPRAHADYPDDQVLQIRVWEEPATKLAASIGVTSVALKKWCRRRGIQTPPRGYWAKARSR